jgi:N-acyl-D-amino-acid deacylase
MADELVLRGGTVVDGTGAERCRADVRVADGRVTAIGPDLRGEREVDCGDRVIAPGFIDTHSHSDLRLFREPSLPMKTGQGITLEVLGQDGVSVAPVRPDAVREAQRQLAGLLGTADGWRWESVGEYLRAARGATDGVGPRLEYLVPHGTLRAYVMGAEARPPTEAELDRMQSELARGLADGACGMSTGLIYPPCCYAERDELTALARVLGRTARPLVVHMRSESDFIMEAIEEMVAVGRSSGAPIHISHWKIAGQDNFGSAERVIDAVEAAQRDGVRLTCDQYPYAAGSTMMGAILPPWMHDGGPAVTLARLRDPAARARARTDMTARGPHRWDNFWGWTGPQGIVIADVASDRARPLCGKNLADAAAGADPLEFALDLLRDEELGVGMVSHSQSEAVVERFLGKPYVNVCTDALLGAKPHPRAYGTYPRILGRYVRERRLVTLEEAVRKMTSQAARALGLADCGEVRVGAPADLVVFDPEVVADRATFAEPLLPPVGIEHVFVRGREVAP